MTEDIISQMVPKMQKALDFLQDEFSTVHTGRANVSMVDSLMVDAYGSKQNIKQVASITVPEPRQILIQPWDKSLSGNIEKAIRDSDLGFNPINTGDSIRINIPELNEERRKEFVKLVREKAEEARISVRNTRSEALNSIKKSKNDGEIGEDEMYRNEERIQQEVGKINQKIDEMLDKKEKELLEI